MASVVKKQNGIKYIQLSDGEYATRAKISLGKMTKKQADTARGHIEIIIRSKNGSGSISPDTQKWINQVPPALRSRLEALELIEPLKNRKCYTVPEWCDRYIAMREKDAGTKADTVRKLQNVSNRLKICFPKTRLDEITLFDAKEFKSYLCSTVGLCENTARRHIGMCRQIFTAAIDKRIISKNPFKGEGLSVTVRPNESRFFYVTSEMAHKVLDACPDAEWRLIFGLSR